MKFLSSFSCYFIFQVEINLPRSQEKEKPQIHKEKGKQKLEQENVVNRSCAESLGGHVGTLNVSGWSGSKSLTPISNVDIANKRPERDVKPSSIVVSPFIIEYSPYLEWKPFEPYIAKKSTWKSNFRRRCPFFLPSFKEEDQNFEEQYLNWIEIGLNKRARYLIYFIVIGKLLFSFMIYFQL